ncbi:hypothetical protein, partial [Klebsiella pneumoniae]|uniref:hypothetical protein n=1 Tax=Klebsiella pneumoniae TaxID=573 RepID=UPI0023B08A67
KRAYCLKTQPATGETYPKSDLFNKATLMTKFSRQYQISVASYPKEIFKVTFPDCISFKI